MSRRFGGSGRLDQALSRRPGVRRAVQSSRGCPFNCEFCNIIELSGRQPRTKTPQQIVDELDALHKLGCRGTFRASSLETLLNLMALYLHLGPHSRFVSRLMKAKLGELRSRPPDVVGRIGRANLLR